jgi:hypothetical protein
LDANNAILHVFTNLNPFFGFINILSATAAQADIPRGFDQAVPCALVFFVLPPLLKAGKFTGVRVHFAQAHAFL